MSGDDGAAPRTPPTPAQGAAPETPDPPAPLVELGIGAAWLVGLAGLVQLADQVVGPANLGVALLGAMGIDLAAGRAGVRWDLQALALDAPRNAVRRVAAGAGVALGAGALVLAAGAALGWLHVDEVSRPSAALAFAVVRSAALATRDELLFRGIPLVAAARAGIPAPVARAFAALVSGAAIVMLPGVTPAALALAVASGWLSAELWGKDRGAWAAVGAGAAWTLFVGSALHGGIADVHFTHGELTSGAAAAGGPAWLAAAALVAGALALRRLPWPTLPAPSEPPA